MVFISLGGYRGGHYRRKSVVIVGADVQPDVGRPAPFEAEGQ